MSTHETIRALQRHPSGWLAAALLCLGTLSTMACHGSSSSPATPAVLSAHGTLGFSCQLDCSFSGEATNSGLGCADNVRGITRLLDDDGREIAREDWSLDPSRKIRPSETFLYQDCCFSLTEVNAMSSYKTDIFWNAVSCP